MISRDEALVKITALNQQYEKSPDKIKEYIWGVCEIQEMLKDPYLPTYYQLLGVDFQVSEAEIKRAFRKMSLQIHPDKNPHDLERATRYFSLVNNAYEILSAAETRAIYDAACHHTEKLQKSAATKEHKAEYTVNVSFTHATSIQKTTLVPAVHRNLYALFEEAHFFDNNMHGLISLCKKNLAIAFAVFKEKRIREKLSHYNWEEIGLKHIEIARELCLLEFDDKHNILNSNNFRMFQQLAKQHAEICRILLRQPALNQLWDNEILMDFLKVHANSPYFADIKEIIDTNSILQSKLAQRMKDQDNLTEEEAIDFVTKNLTQIIQSLEKYFPRLWPHRKKIRQKINLCDYLNRIKSTQVINAIKRDIDLDDLIQLSSAGRMACIKFDPIPIAKLILENPDTLAVNFSGAEIEKLKNTLGDDTESIDKLIMNNPMLRQRYDAWVQFLSLLKTRDALSEQKIEALIIEGKLSSDDIFICFLSLQDFPSVSRFFDSEKLRKYVNENHWISLASMSYDVCLKLLRSPLTEKVSSANLNNWVKLYGSEVFFCIEENSKLQQMMHGYSVLHQPGTTPQSSFSLVTSAEAKTSQENLTFSQMQQLRIIYADRMRSCEPLYTYLEEQVANDPASHLVTVQQRQHFIKLIFGFIGKPEGYKQINEAIDMSQINRDQDKNLIKLKQELITQIKALFLQELHFISESAKPENRVPQLKKSFYLMLGVFLFKSQKILQANSYFRALDNLTEQSPQVQFCARVCSVVVEAKAFEENPQTDPLALERLKAQLSTILDDTSAQDFPEQMASVRREIENLDETVPALCLRLRNQSKNEELQFIALEKAKTFYADAFSMSKWISGATPAFLDRSFKLLIELLNIAQDSALNQVKAYMMDIYWIQGEFKKAYELGTAILPLDKLTNEVKVDAIDNAMVSKVANRLGFCLLQPELQEQYQKDKTTAENYFKYVARTAAPESAENAFAAIGEAACLAKEGKLTQDKATQLFNDTQNKANKHGRKDLSYLSYRIVACSQVINLLQAQGKDIASEVRSLTCLIPKFFPYYALPIPGALLNEAVLTVFKQYAQQGVQKNSLYTPSTSSRAMLPVATNPIKEMAPAYK